VLLILELRKGVGRSAPFAFVGLACRRAGPFAWESIDVAATFADDARSIFEVSAGAVRAAAARAWAAFDAIVTPSTHASGETAGPEEG
jgi:hypothetical protein